jgi:hypothetical protein
MGSDIEFYILSAKILGFFSCFLDVFGFGIVVKLEEVVVKILIFDAFDACLTKLFRLI